MKAPAGPRICRRCQLPLAERRPVFLVGLTGGKIVGPLHAGCAERIVLAHKRKGAEGWEQIEQYELFGNIGPTKESGE